MMTPKENRKGAMVCVGCDYVTSPMRNMLLLTESDVLNDIEYLQYQDDFMAVINLFLLRAVENLNTELVRVLLGKGADPNSNGSSDMESLLHGLVHKYGSQRTLKGDKILEVARLLLDHKANPNIVGCNNLTPVQICRSVRARVFEDLLISYGADVKGNTPV